MPVYHTFGQELVNRDEFLTRAAEFERSVSFDVGTVTTGGGVRPFTNIEFGSPLSILIRRVYTGRFPERKMFGSRRPMLITSAIKDISTSSAAAQALNIVKTTVTPHSVFAGPSAREEGTALLYYSPAIASSLITVSIQMVFDDFDDELFKRASQLFTSLSGVPIFIPASGYLLGAASILKLASDAGNALFSGRAALDENIELDFSFGGGSIPQPGFWVLSSAPLDLKRFQFDPANGLIEKSTGGAYNGEDPVIVLSLDGTIQPSLVSFTPLMASASLLGRFMSQKEGSEVMTDTVLSAMKVFSDVTYRKKADELRQQISALTQGNEIRQKLEAQFNALNASIAEPSLRLSVL